MKLRSIFASLALAVPALLTTAACSSNNNSGTKGGTPGSKVGSAALLPDLCNTYCDHVKTCNNASDADTCKNECTNANAVSFSKLRTDVVQMVSSCIDAADCSTVLSSKVFGKCSHEAVASVAPSDAAKQLCDELETAEKKCSSQSDKGQCLDESKLYNDDTLNSGRQCAGKACTAMGECVSAAFGGRGSATSGGGLENGTTTTPPPAPHAGSGSGGGSGGGASGGGSGSGSSASCVYVGASYLTLDHGGSCDQCAATSCCTEARDCALNSSCYGFERCFSNCGASSSCRSSCVSTWGQSAQPALGSLNSCVQTSCAAACSHI